MPKRALIRSIAGLSLLLLGAIGFSAGLYASTKPAARATGIYSDLRYNAEGGDLVGVELMLVVGDQGHYVVFQSAEGEPRAPVVVRAELRGRTLSFTLPERPGDYSGRFEARLFDDRLEGAFDNGALSPSGAPRMVLMKGRSYWK